MRLPSWDEVAARYDVAESLVEVPPRTFRLSHPRDTNALVDAMTDEDFGPDERLPYWSMLWSAARELARWLSYQPARGGTTLEIGAGLGLPSLAASARGDRVLATDYEADALAFLAQNASQNGLEVEVELVDYRAWPAHHRARYETVIASDVLYEARAVEPMVQSLRFLLARGGEAHIADPGRPHLGRFLEALGAEGFVVEAARAGDATIVRAILPG